MIDVTNFFNEETGSRASIVVDENNRVFLELYQNGNLIETEEHTGKSMNVVENLAEDWISRQFLRG